MKTAVVFDTGEGVIFHTVDGDKSHLDGTIININNEELWDEVSYLDLGVKLSSADFLEKCKDCDCLINIGFMP